MKNPNDQNRSQFLMFEQTGRFGIIGRLVGWVECNETQHKF